MFTQILGLLLYILILCECAPFYFRCVGCVVFWFVLFFKECLAIDCYPVSQYLSFKLKMAPGIKEVSLEHICCSSHHLEQLSQRKRIIF